GWTLASALECATLITPPDEPDAEAVVIWSPVGAPESVPSPPTPSRCCVPEPGAMSSTRFCRHGGKGGAAEQRATLVKSTPWIANVCGPPVWPPFEKKIGAPPGELASWKLEW